MRPSPPILGSKPDRAVTPGPLGHRAPGLSSPTRVWSDSAFSVRAYTWELSYCRSLRYCPVLSGVGGTTALLHPHRYCVYYCTFYFMADTFTSFVYAFLSFYSQHTQRTTAYHPHFSTISLPHFPYFPPLFGCFLGGDDDLLRRRLRSRLSIVCFWSSICLCCARIILACSKARSFCSFFSP